jgi:hypothetical protein
MVLKTTGNASLGPTSPYSSIHLHDIWPWLGVTSHSPSPCQRAWSLEIFPVTSRCLGTYGSFCFTGVLLCVLQRHLPMSKSSSLWLWKWWKGTRKHKKGQERGRKDGGAGKEAILSKFAAQEEKKQLSETLYINIYENMNICNNQDRFNMQKSTHTRMSNTAGYKVVNTAWSEWC